MKNCCCCIGLKVGGVIICCIELVCLVCVLSSIQHGIVFLGSDIPPSEYSFILCLIIVNIIQVEAVAISIWGIIEGKHRFMLPHIHLSMQILSLLGFMMLYYAIAGLVIFAKYGKNGRGYGFEFELVGCGIAFAILFYFTRVIRSLYKLIKESQSDWLPTIDSVESTERIAP